MGKEVKCFNQIFKPEKIVCFEGWGNCRECFPDENNKNCRGYHPVEVETEEEEHRNYNN